jgi:NADH-quinone oxidoreductase subunit H
MRLGWKVFVPLAIAWIFVAGCLVYFGVVGPAPAVEAMS